MTCLVARALKNLSESDSAPPPGVASVVLGLPRGPPSLHAPTTCGGHWHWLDPTTFDHWMPCPPTDVISQHRFIWTVKKYFQHSWNQFQKIDPNKKTIFSGLKRPQKTKHEWFHIPWNFCGLSWGCQLVESLRFFLWAKILGEATTKKPMRKLLISWGLQLYFIWILVNTKSIAKGETSREG